MAAAAAAGGPRLPGAGAQPGPAAPPALPPQQALPSHAAHASPAPPRAPAVAAVAADGKPTILVAEKLGAGGVEMLKEVGEVDVSLNMTKEELIAKISLVDALVIRSATKVRPAAAPGWARFGWVGLCWGCFPCGLICFLHTTF